MNSCPPRIIDVVIISDAHLGTYGCHAKELLQYLKSIKPKTLILNGDIIDIWQFTKNYWPSSHMLVVKELMDKMSSGCKITYIPGNHDEMLRKFAGLEVGNFQIKNKLILKQGNKKVWIFHGDIFDFTMQHSRWIAKLGSMGYGLLILINRLINKCLVFFGRNRMSLSKKIKNSVKSAVEFINNFEEVAAEIAIQNNYDFVACGHIHKAEIKKIKINDGETTYLNSGDWVESLTALEYNNKKWNLYHYLDDSLAKEIELPKAFNNKEIFKEVLDEFYSLKKAKA